MIKCHWVIHSPLSSLCLCPCLALSLSIYPFKTTVIFIFWKTAHTHTPMPTHTHTHTNRDEMVITASLFLYNNFVKKSFLGWQNFPMALGHLHIVIYNFSPAWNNLPHATLVNDWDTPWWCLTFNSARAPHLPKQPFPFTLPQRPSNFSLETEIL